MQKQVIFAYISKRKTIQQNYESRVFSNFQECGQAGAGSNAYSPGAGAYNPGQNFYPYNATQSRNTQISNARPVCQKIVTKTGNTQFYPFLINSAHNAVFFLLHLQIGGDKKFYQRNCVWKTNNIDPCVISRSNPNFEACEICDTDRCNSGFSSKTIWLPLVVMPAVAAIFKTIL